MDARPKPFFSVLPSMLFPRPLPIKRLLLKNGCYQCHGTVGEGAHLNPPAPRPSPQPLALAVVIADFRDPSPLKNRALLN
jgi:hypothetical protein